MIRKFYVAIASVALTTLLSCGGNDNKDYIDKSLITPEAEKKAAEQAANNGAIPNGPVIPGVTDVNSGVQTTPVNVLPQTNNAAAAGNLNPAHGQPGHVCELAVGAPLNSKPAVATPQATTVSTQPSPVTVTQQPSTQKTAPGMNPPHGEPGHRCDIGVGLPLDSKPAATGAAPANIVTTQQPAQNTVVTTQQPAQKTAPGMNPAHGEPGHRCDISVGAPLDSKPAAPAAVEAKKPAVPPLLAPPVKRDSSKN